MSGRVATGAVAVLAAAVGLAAGLWLGGASRPPSPTPATAPAGGDEPEELRAALRAERDAGARLRAENEELRHQVEWLLALSMDAENAGAEAIEAPDAGAEPSEGGAAAAPGAEGFDEDALVAAGLAAEEAQRLRERYDESQMRVLFLRDRAAREGWAATPRFRMAVRATRNALLQEVGPSDYDAMLYAAGRPNRVVVQEVLHGSPARDAGLRAGDVIVRYGGEPIFDGLDLRRATVTGRADANTAVDVVRDGERVRIYVPRGPLGARLRLERRTPDME